MGLFDDAGIDAAELGGERLENCERDGVISNVEIKNSNAGDPYLVFYYQADGWEWDIQDWFRILPPGRKISDCDDTDDSFNVYEIKSGRRAGQTVRQTEKKFFETAYKNIKRRLLDFGVPPENVNKVNPLDLKGQKVRLTFGPARGDFPNLTGVSKPGASGTALPKPPSVPGAPSVLTAPSGGVTSITTTPVSTGASATPVVNAGPSLPTDNPFGNI